MDASGRPGMLKLYRPAMKSAFLMSCVVARNPAVLTTDEGPNRIPSRLMRNTRPFAVSVPRISEGPSPPVTRLSTTEELPGWLKRTLSGADIERMPVDDRAVARLIDDDRGAALTLDGRRAADDRAAFGAGRSRPRGERDERRGRE